MKTLPFDRVRDMLQEERDKLADELYERRRRAAIRAIRAEIATYAISHSELMERRD